MLQFYEPEQDYGTPAMAQRHRPSASYRRPVRDRARRHLGHARRFEAGVKVPRLCATDSLEPFGSCRVCLVEIEGMKGYPASCTTPVQPGMVVRTQTDRSPACAAT